MLRFSKKNQCEASAERAGRQLDLYRTPVTKAETLLPAPYLFVRRSTPKASPVFATYWVFAQRRQRLFFSRLFPSEASPPVADTILQRYRFTNVYRASDRVSQFLIRHVLYDRQWSPTNLLFRILIFKFFNKIDTWQALKRAVGEICWESYSFKNYDACLTKMMEGGSKIYSAAYIMPSGKSIYGFKRKHRNHLKIIENIIKTNAADRILDAKRFGDVFSILRGYPCVGPFVGYQLAIDANYSPLINFSENDFVEPGPGALDGIAKCFFDLGDYSPSDIIRYMVDVQTEAFEKFAPNFETLWGRPLQLIDCQNIFCEVSKYSRVAHPDILGISSRARIKQLYRPASLSLERPWYPPKWGLNERIAADPRLAS